MSFVGYALVNGHIGKAPPLCGTILALLQIAEVVHMLVCLYLKGVQPVACIGVLLAGTVSLEVVAQVETVEAPPGVARADGLLQVYHLVVLQFVETSVHVVSLLLRVRQDGAEERQRVVATLQPERVDHCRHIVYRAGLSCLPHEAQDAEEAERMTERLELHGCKVMK